MDKRKNAFIRILIFLFILFMFCLSSGADAQNADENDEINRFGIATHNVYLYEIISDIKAKHNIEITGLYNRGNELISFDSDATDIKNFIKDLLDALKERNYLFEFSKDSSKSIRRVWVLNKSNTVVSSQPEAEPPANGDGADQGEENSDASPRQTAVRVISILENTQAVSMGFQPNDIVIEYDGIPITESGQLVNLVKERETKQSINLTILRDCNPIPMTAAGGLMGIRVRTETLSGEIAECVSQFR